MFSLTLEMKKTVEWIVELIFETPCGSYDYETEMVFGVNLLPEPTLTYPQFDPFKLISLHFIDNPIIFIQGGTFEKMSRVNFWQSCTKGHKDDRLFHSPLAHT